MDDKVLKEIQEAQTQIAEKISDNMRAFGTPTTVGWVLGIIYMNREPMTLDELSERTGMSKTRMSQVVREMMDMNIAERSFPFVGRKDYYQVEQDYYQTFISLFTSNWRQAINKSRQFEQRLKNRMETVLHTEDLTEEAEAQVNDLLYEIQEWIEYYDWIFRLIQFFESGEVFKHVPKNPKTEGGNHKDE
ncbi:GbsR/MarR family transcriptional regulator [Salibacterium salarium]|uniref:HTH-type transcriptional regulator n=1 Tax=Salibacterium salarium TaxID=284579 RepID=A0A428N3Q3_9BACI|nr:GbsR/MarR family transcriptional regulator [Salibacterium salarium]RSL33085.1 GbsR/MarR family transcriptional regulator [Salibacterium salarium]